MQIITRTNELKAACDILSKGGYVTVDTEFLREHSFWPELCLIQCAAPAAVPKDKNDAAQNNEEEENVFIIDPLVKGIDLSSFFELMADENVIKVFHAARQDIEIVYKMAGIIPTPVFDTQIAASVLGYGDSISYDQLVYKTNGRMIDKSSRFTDWKRRPLSSKQLRYAAADVTHLRQVYETIRESLEQKKRGHWVTEEMEILTSPETYEQKPENAWQRLKLRVRKPRDLHLLKVLARWREELAQGNDVPRGRILKDEAIYELASNPPKKIADLDKMRGLSRGFDKRQFGANLIQVVDEALQVPKENLPKLPKRPQNREGSSAASEMLKLLLKLTAEENGVAAKIIATVDDIDKIAADDEADVKALKGWRRELFGDNALKLKAGKLAITYRDKKIELIEV